MPTPSVNARKVKKIIDPDADYSHKI